MSSPTPDCRKVEQLWLNRLNDVKLRLEFARSYANEVERDHSSGDIPENERQFARYAALRAENIALAMYNRVLRIYKNLAVNGIVPDEDEWLKSQAANASRSDPSR
jgi:hypothetical protein